MIDSFSKMKIGLALGSGGARGLAHIGVLKALLEHHVPIHCIAGSSAGALIGGMYLALSSISEVERIATTFSYKDLIRIFADFGSISGLVKGEKIEDFLDTFLKKATIESLPIPFTAVTTDIQTATPVYLTTGSLAQAIRASGAIPALIDMKEVDGKFLIDGGGSEPVPVRAAKALGATHVIAVNLDTYPFLKREGDSLPNVKDMGLAALQMLRFNLSNELCREADMTIVPDVAHISTIDPRQFVHGDNIIQKGYDATVAMLPTLHTLVPVI